MAQSGLEETLLAQITGAGLPIPIREYAKAIPARRFRFDFAWEDLRLLVEVQGGTWVRGRHSRGSGYERDREKANLATLNGWMLLEVSAGHIRNGSALAWITSAIALCSSRAGISSTA